MKMLVECRQHRVCPTHFSVPRRSGNPTIIAMAMITSVLCFSVRGTTTVCFLLFFPVHTFPSSALAMIHCRKACSFVESSPRLPLLQRPVDSRELLPCSLLFARSRQCPKQALPRRTNQAPKRGCSRLGALPLAQKPTAPTMDAATAALRSSKYRVRPIHPLRQVR